MQQLKRIGKEFEIEINININKTNIMIITKKPSYFYIVIGGQKIEQENNLNTYDKNNNRRSILKLRN